MCFVVILYSIFGVNVLTDCMCIQVHVDVDLCTSFISTYMYIFTDCYDYGITITGATDTRIELSVGVELLSSRVSGLAFLLSKRNPCCAVVPEPTGATILLLDVGTS